jgi:hypothetical protein
VCDGETTLTEIDEQLNHADVYAQPEESGTHYHLVLNNY